MDSSWDKWVDRGIERLLELQLNLKLSTVFLSNETNTSIEDEYEVLDETYPFSRASVEVYSSDSAIENWLLPIDSTGEGAETYTHKRPDHKDGKLKKLLLFSGNDYLGLGSHPSIAKAAAKAAHEYGMGPRGSGVVCGYTNYHRLLESSLADLKKKEDCLLCPTGFSANMALMVTLGTLSFLLAQNGKPAPDDRMAIFSDELNHGSIVDGIRIAERQGTVKSYIYKHCDMSHLSSLLSSCKLKKKVVVTDSLFSMDGHFAPLPELVNLRKRHGFLLIIDDAHATFVCGKNGGGAAEMFDCEKDIDICVGTLSKAAACQGGFIACSKKWKLLVLSVGRSFVFTTTASVPVVAAAHAAVVLAKKEGWRRKTVWSRVRDFQALTGISITSPIISLVLGNAETAFEASRYLMRSGFHVCPIIPPAVPPNSCRLRIILSAMHSMDDMKKLIAALSNCVNFQDIGGQSFVGTARL